jgi:hypothetical protein
MGEANSLPVERGRRNARLCMGLSSLFGVVAAFALAAGAAERKAFDLAGEPHGRPPAGWTFGRTGQGRAGNWVVEDGKALGASGRVLVQRDGDASSYRFPIALVPNVSFADGSVSVRCQPISGRVDQACGVLLRARGENEYVIARSNALEGNVRLYNVVAGSRKQIASWSGPVKAGAWHTLRLSAAGDQYVVTYEGEEVIRTRDRTISGTGGAGLWTKADSVTAFEAVTVEKVR